MLGSRPWSQPSSRSRRPTPAAKSRFNWPRSSTLGWRHRCSSPPPTTAAAGCSSSSRQGASASGPAASLRQRPFLDLAGRVLAGGERGLLGLAFHPQFAANRRFFVNYTRRPDGATVVSEFRASEDRRRRPPGRAQAAHRPAALRQPQWRDARLRPGRRPLHRPGRRRLRGRSAEPGAEPRTRCSARSCASTSTAASPTPSRPTNPFARGGGRRGDLRPGLSQPVALLVRPAHRPALCRRRRPERGRGDRHRRAAAATTAGALHGGRPLLRAGPRLRRARLKLPVATYAQTGGRCSITGGYVYRGRDIPALDGTYVYADFCTGEIFGLAGGQTTVLLDTELSIASFGENRAGELYVVDLQGTIHAIVAAGSRSLNTWPLLGMLH